MTSMYMLPGGIKRHADNSLITGHQHRSATAGKVKNYTLSNGLRPGLSLPTETELCELLEVLRFNIREAVQTLISLVVLQVRHGTFAGEMSLGALVQT